MTDDYHNVVVVVFCSRLFICYCFGDILLLLLIGFIKQTKKIKSFSVLDLNYTKFSLFFMYLFNKLYIFNKQVRVNNILLNIEQNKIKV